MLLLGAGLSSVMVSFFMSTYYNVIIAYFLYYLFTAMRASAPWSECSNKWNTDRCWQPSLNVTRPNFSQPPSEEFYELVVSFVYFIPPLILANECRNPIPGVMCWSSYLIWGPKHHLHSPRSSFTTSLLNHELNLCLCIVPPVLQFNGEPHI